ncbi:hypothetical protein SFRURICE_009301 [Spodoptera frugiperda]|nr:hypothetical protein SFRURICE_009301 [Spodoptera frugiperda]
MTGEGKRPQTRLVRITRIVRIPYDSTHHTLRISGRSCMSFYTRQTKIRCVRCVRCGPGDAYHENAIELSLKIQIASYRHLSLTCIERFLSADGDASEGGADEREAVGGGHHHRERRALQRRQDQERSDQKRQVN